MRKDEPMEIDLLELLEVIKNKILIIILCAIIGAGVAGSYSMFMITPMYQSTSQIYILTQSTSITSLADIQMGSSLAKDYEVLIKSRPVVSQVKRQAGVSYSNKELKNMLTITNTPDTRLIDMTVTCANPNEAADIANAFANVARIHISKIMETDMPKLTERAIVSKAPVSPDIIHNTLIGFMAGAILAAAVAIGLALLNDRIKGPEVIEKSLQLTTLAIIPEDKSMKENDGSARDKKKRRKK